MFQDLLGAGGEGNDLHLTIQEDPAGERVLSIGVGGGDISTQLEVKTLTSTSQGLLVLLVDLLAKDLHSLQLWASIPC